MFIYILFCTFGLLNVPKVYWHDCERTHVHHNHESNHNHDELSFESSEDCSICDFHFFPFTIHHYQVAFYFDKDVTVHGDVEIHSIAMDTPTPLLRGPPSVA